VESRLPTARSKARAAERRGAGRKEGGKLLPSPPRTERGKEGRREGGRKEGSVAIRKAW
jgi:hypothetical protein